MFEKAAERPRSEWKASPLRFNAFRQQDARAVFSHEPLHCGPARQYQQSL